MVIRLFDIENGVIVPTEHCTILKDLRVIKENYPDNFMKIYEYIFYMTCPNPDLNPFFHYPEEDKEEAILEQIEADFSTEDDLILAAKAFCEKLYETPTSRAYIGIKIMLDNLAKTMASTITTGRDGNGPFLLSAAKQYQEIRESFKGVYKDLMEEQKSQVRGGHGLAYDSQ